MRLLKILNLYKHRSGLTALLFLSSVVLSSVVLVAAPSGATLITLDAQVGPVDYGTLPNSVTLDPIALNDPLDTNDIQCLAGVCDIANQDWTVFRVSVLSGELGQVGVTLVNTLAGGLDALGMGYFLEGGSVQDGSGGTNFYTGTIPAVPDADVPTFNFETNVGGEGISGTTLALFVAFADGSIPQSPSPPFDLINGLGGATFSIQEFTGAGANSALGNFTTVVPEPGTAVLLGLGMAILGVRRRGRS